MLTIQIKDYLKQSRPLLLLVRWLRRTGQSIALAYDTVAKEYDSGTEKQRHCQERIVLIQEYIESHPVRKLQIGAGYTPLPGWLNSDIAPASDDIIYLDATETFPIPSDTFDYIFCEHLFEHISFDEGRFMLSESYRVLKPGGTIRISTPDILAIVGLFSPDKSDEQTQYINEAKSYLVKFFPEDINYENECFIVNLFFEEWGHQFLYDFKTLKEVLLDANFVDIVRYAPGESDDDNLKQIESHWKIIGDIKNRFETMVIEARKDGFN